MEKRKSSLQAAKLCRFCLSVDEPLIPLYEKTPKASIPLSLKILSSVSVETFPSDKMPTFICNRCKFFMDMCYEYKDICRSADKSLLQYVQAGTALEPIVWPPEMVKLFRQGAKPSKVNVLQTAGGATIEVTSQDADEMDSEEDDENVYNVKMQYGSAEGASTCVKIVTSKEETPTKENNKKKGFYSVAKLTKHIREHAGPRQYPCKYCGKSFIKSHHFTRHLRLKHSKESSKPNQETQSPRPVFGDSHLRTSEEFRCEQCQVAFTSQDDLIYHSAIHATQNLTCPLCQERFPDVDAVTQHIKSHVTGMEFMCDLCELVFTSKEKLHQHIKKIHEDEEETGEDEQEESSEGEMDGEDDEDSSINVKQVGDHMVVELKKPNDFLLRKTDPDSDEKMNNTNSEESEPESSQAALPMPPTLTPAPKVSQQNTSAAKTDNTNSNALTTMLRKAEEMKRIAAQVDMTQKKEKPKEAANSGGNDKSLRLLEKELQELQRTKKRDEPGKTPPKSVESLRGRRPQVHTSTPKPKPVEEKKSLIMAKSSPADKKQPERRAVKENKKPDERDNKNNNISKEEKKEERVNVSKDDGKEKEKQTVVKNGASNKSLDESVRRSARPSRVRDYAKMTRDNHMDTTNSDEDTEDDDEEYIDTDKSESRPKPRRQSKPAAKPAPAPAPAAAAAGSPAPAAAPRKRGRPRKDKSATPAKVKKDADDTMDTDDSKVEEPENDEKETSVTEPPAESKDEKTPEENVANVTLPNAEPKPANIVMTPTGTTLKKVPIKSLPPGVKPMPLPGSQRSKEGLCEMQIGKKVVKVQKIVMTKAEVEAMAKQGLVEMKDGTMVLKPGVKIPADPNALKSTLIAQGASKFTLHRDASKEISPKPSHKGPSRCYMEGE